ncbi:hypothetical protein [Sutterella wadsworthensis]|uniref:LPD3 domain-containing protein n=1 Tax=Sutterella wadsworthensis TaxID=40545 RepID=UPI003A8C9C45
MIDISSFISEDRYKIPQGVRDWDGSRITAPEVGFWDGTKDAIKDILPNAALHVGSALTGMFTGSGRQATIEQAAAEAQEQGIPITDPKEFARKQAEYMDASAKELRRIAEEEYTPNPEATGVAGQIIHGVGTELTKAVLVAPIAAASPQAAALAYGAMHGVETTQRYKDKGVDENTANWLGVSAFGTGTLGFLIPATAGPTRLASAVYGAITNPVANVSEDLTTRMILRKQNYEALAATINPFDPLNLAVAAFVGGGFGTIGFHKKATAATKKAEEKPKEAAQEQAQTLADSVVEGAKTVKKAAAEVPDVSQLQEASTLRMAENGVVLQNRNRGTASSIVQMQQIAGNPIYNMVSVSREFSSGAPVIAFPNNISEGQWGRTEMVSASDGSQMEMRYAVVEADNLQVSNFADGTRNADYGVVKQNVTIAGNGRVAGISAAYERGTAEKYKADLIKDADNVGIKPSVIEGMKEPVLVRVMSDRDAGRPDIAMLSNQSGTKALDATEQAENDAAAIDVSKLTFDENGNISDETVKQFAALVPDNSSLVDRNGIPNTLARPRLERAIFQRAYGNANLASLLTDTESEGGRVVSIFLKLAPKMMQLEGAGDLDFRDALVAALNEVYVARASGSFKSLKELAASQSLGRTPETQAFLDYLSGVGNQVNAPTQVFAQLADWSLANKLQAEGMFADESPLPTRADLMMEFQDLTGVPVDPYVLDMIKAQVTRAQAREKISTTILEKLAAAGQEAEQVEAQSRIWTNAVMHLAELAHRDPLEILPNIDLEGVPSSDDGFTMPVTQGRNWQYGDHAAKNPDYRVRVTRIESDGSAVPDNKGLAQLIKPYRGENGTPLINDATGWRLTISGSDADEIVHGVSHLSQNKEDRRGNAAVLQKLPEVVKAAFPAESYRDIKAAQGVKGKDAFLRGMHRFYAPVVVDGRDYLVKITVKDRSADGGKGNKDRLAAYQIVGMDIEKAQPMAGPVIQREETSAGGASAEQLSPDDSSPEKLIASRYAGGEITVRDMLTGVKRDGDVVYKKETGADGKESWVKDEDKRSRFFMDEPNEWAYAEDGGYWRAPADPASDMEFNQIIGETGVRNMDARNGEFYQVAYHGSPYLFDKFSLDHVGEGVRAQWYGWGMYFSLDKNVARQYASNLYNASGEARDRYNRLSAEAERLQHELSAAEESGDMTVADSLRAQLTEAKAAVDKALPDHPRVYDAEIPEDSVMVQAATTIDQQPEIVQQAFRNLLGDVDDSKKGRALYNELAKKLGSKKAASEALRNEGVLGLRYSNSMDGECAVVWDDKAIEIREFLQEAKENGEIRGSYNPQTNTIRLTPNADITTFSHEMGHFWLTNAIRLSTLPGSDLSLRRDVRKLMDTWGIKDASEWEKLGTEGQRQYHEQFASWVEEFLATGRVPNDSLRGFFEKMRQWITDLYRDIRSHLNSRYRQEFGKDLPALSDEVRDILERNIAYEDRLAAVQRDFSPTTAQTDAARYATFENVVKNDQLVDRSDAQSLQGSLFAEQQAKDALNNREKVNVNGPMDADMLQGRQDAVKKSLHMPESLEARPKDEGMPVHEIPKAEPKPEAQEEGGIAAVVRRVSDALLGKQPEENAAPKEDADVADIMRRSDEVLEKSPDMQLTPDEVSDANDVKPGKTASEYVAAVDVEAQSIEEFANVMSTAAMCVLRNGGITHA